MDYSKQEIALHYASLGFSVFPCRISTDKSIDKSPATKNGFKDATTDEDQIKRWFFDDTYYVAIATGNMSNGLVVFDIDVNKDGDSRTVEEKIDIIESEYGLLNRTVEVETKSGGRHLYYFDQNTEISSKAKVLEKTLNVDIRANGGYVIAPDDESYFLYDSEDYLLDKSKIAIIPAWLKTKLSEKQATPITQTALISLSDIDLNMFRSALAYIPSDDRDLWIRVGHALKNLNAVQAQGLFIEWSMMSDKYDPQDTMRVWKSLKPNELTEATVFYIAGQYGWASKEDIKVESKTPGKAPKSHVEAREEENRGNICLSRPKFPEELLKPPGLVGDLASYITETSPKEQPILSLAAALTACGTMMGRKVMTESGIRPNIFTLGVAPSGSGKDSARQVIKKLFARAGVPQKASVEDIASDSSIVEALHACPSQIFLIDEMGRFLNSVKSASKAPHLANIVTVMMKLYSSSGSPFAGKIYADTTKNKIVDCPNLCLYGTTVPNNLYNSFTTEQVVDGFLSRLLIFESESPNPKLKRKFKAKQIPENLIQEVIKWEKKPTNYNPKGNIDQIERCEPMIVKMTDEAEEMLYDFEEELSEKRNSLSKNQDGEIAILMRTCQQAAQIALIVACGRNSEFPLIETADIEYGIALANHLANHMIYTIGCHVSDTAHEDNIKKVRNFIYDCGSEGATLSQITRKFRKLTKAHKKEAIDSLIESEDIEKVIFPTSGNIKTVYRIKG